MRTFLPASFLILASAGLFIAATLDVQAQDVTTEATNASNPYDEDPDAIYLPQGLEANVWAESPQLYNPTNIDVDAKGRVWVVEAIDYRVFNNPPEGRLSRPEGERIVVLDDTDGDGRADESTVFAQDDELVAPLGIAVFGNRVYVSASPGIYVYTDTDGDGRADQKKTFLSGFGGEDHDHGVHSMTAGPGGRFHFTAGNAGPHVVTDRSEWTLRSGVQEDSLGGSTVMVSDDGRKWLQGLMLRVNPDGTDLTVTAHNFRNNYEGFADSFGDTWINDNDDDGYESTRVVWAMLGGNYGYAGRDGTRTWGQDRRPDQNTFTAHWHQEDPGVLPAGDHTGPGAPTGIALYESDVLGELRGTLLSVDSGKNTVWGYRPQRMGAGWALDKTSFFSTLPDSTVTDPAAYNAHTPEDHDRWYRPSDVAVGTDGSIYVADWYDQEVGYHAMGDTTGYGRIFRISPSDRKLVEPEIDLSTTEGQIQALMSPAKNVRFQGFVHLREQGRVVIDEVTELLGRDNPYHRARAVWLLAHLGPEGISTVEEQLDSPNPRMRVAAYRALRQAYDQERTLGYARQIADDPSPAVRRAVAVSLREVPISKSRDLMVTLARHYHSGDRFALEAYGLAAFGEEEEVYELLTDEFGDEDPTQWSRKWADLVWRLHPVAAVDQLKERAGSPYVSWEEQKRALVALGFIEDEAAVDAMRQLAELDSQPQVAERARWWLNYRNATGRVTGGAQK